MTKPHRLPEGFGLLLGSILGLLFMWLAAGIVWTVTDFANQEPEVTEPRNEFGHRR
jgi:hypothetical protein